METHEITAFHNNVVTGPYIVVSYSDDEACEMVADSFGEMVHKYMLEKGGVIAADYTGGPGTNMLYFGNKTQSVMLRSHNISNKLYRAIRDGVTRRCFSHPNGFFG